MKIDAAKQLKENAFVRRDECVVPTISFIYSSPFKWQTTPKIFFKCRTTRLSVKCSTNNLFIVASINNFVLPSERIFVNLTEFYLWNQQFSLTWTQVDSNIRFPNFKWLLNYFIVIYIAVSKKNNFLMFKLPLPHCVKWWLHRVSSDSAIRIRVTAECPLEKNLGRIRRI